MRGNPLRRRRAGSALLEVLVALVVLAIAGTALITFLGQTAHSMRNALESERLAHAAAREMNKLVVASRDQLVASIGRRSVDGWTIGINELTPALFVIVIAQSDTSSVLLHTTLYRPSVDSVDDLR